MELGYPGNLGTFPLKRSSMLSSRGRHHPLGFASVVAVLTLGAFATPTSAEAMVSSHDGIVDAVVSAADQTRPAPKKPGLAA